MEHVETVIIGGGQAGLSVGYYLQQQGHQFVILDAHARIGDAWRKRWDSLRLFTPARYSSLAGMPFPASGHTLPTKDEMADYLEAYATRFKLPVKLGVRVDKLSKQGAASSWRRATCASRPRMWSWRCQAGNARGCLPLPRNLIRASSSYILVPI